MLKKSLNGKKKFASLKVFFAVVFISAISNADSLRQNIELGSSVSQSYDARNVLINPAALGFQTELNGTSFLSSFTFGAAKNLEDQFSLSLGLGYGGIAVEQLSEPLGSFSRYSFALGFPLTDLVFVGVRYSFTRSINPNLDSFDSLDFGFQYRPFSFMSFGGLIQSLNEPVISGVKKNSVLNLGLTIRPLDRLDLMVDLSTDTRNTYSKIYTQGMISYEVMRGIHLQGGYHSRDKFMVGAQLNFSNFSFFSTAQPGSDYNKLSVGTQVAVSPYPSALAPLTALKINLEPTLREQPSTASLFSSKKQSLVELLDLLDKAGRHPEIEIVLLDVEDFPLGLAAAQDIHDSLSQLKKKGKQIHIQLGNADLKEYLIASAGDRIFMSHEGELKLLGVRSERYYLKGTLDKIGVQGHFVAKGKYKNAPELFTRKKASPESEEVTQELLKQTQQIVLNTLSKTRNISNQKWEQLVHHALFSPEEALKAGLIDEIRTLHEIDKSYKQYWVRSDLREQSKELNLPPRIAVIVASGDILSKKNKFLVASGSEQIIPQSIEAKFKVALADNRTKAIVLRVASPGGEILPSRQIAAMVEAAQDKKPVIVSMGDVAASGGYLISAPAEKILAQPSTLTGSIGVFSGKFDLSDLYKKIDLNKQITSPSPFADLFSEDRGFNSEQLKILNRQVENYYSGFVHYVSVFRKLSTDKVEAAAQGRVWPGIRAHPLGLVDELGGLSKAIQLAAQKTGLKPGKFQTAPLVESAGLFGDWEQGLWARMNPLPEDLTRSLAQVATLASGNHLYYWAPVP